MTSDEKYYVAVTPVLDFKDGNNIFYWSFSKSSGDTFLWKDKTDLLGLGKLHFLVGADPQANAAPGPKVLAVVWRPLAQTSAFNSLVGAPLLLTMILLSSTSLN
jgi:hypothetical protein